MPFDGTIEDSRARALDLLDRTLAWFDNGRRWSDGGYARPDNRRCILAALHHVAFGAEPDTRYFDSCRTGAAIRGLLSARHTERAVTALLQTVPPGYVVPRQWSIREQALIIGLINDRLRDFDKVAEWFDRARAELLNASLVTEVCDAV